MFDAEGIGVGGVAALMGYHNEKILSIFDNATFMKTGGQIVLTLSVIYLLVQIYGWIKKISIMNKIGKNVEIHKDDMQDLNDLDNIK